MSSAGMIVHFGPAHPAAHGVLRCMLVVQGEWVLSSIISLGLLHRGTERLMELRTAEQSVAYMDRLDYVSMIANELCYVQCYERLLHIATGYRHAIARVMLVESTRIQNHLLNIACHAGDVGCLVALLWLFEDREALYDVVSTWCGARMHASCIIPGGLRSSTVDAYLDVLLEHAHTMNMRLDSMLSSVLLHRVWCTRLASVGVVLSSARHTGSSGVLMRCAGTTWDIRVVAQDSIYDTLPITITAGTHADSMDRAIIRILEMMVAVSIMAMICTIGIRTIDTAGTHATSASLHNVVHAFMGAALVSSVYTHSIESPKGELMVTMQWVSGLCWRSRIRPADLVHVLLLQQLCIGTCLSDVVMLVGTVDIVFGAVDM
uniref:NADH dehydrogenase subunit 7 n=1 Tax=Diplonema ambulator TaxID=182243 RepID=A0A2D2AJS7_9EUGL|nr:NADH dehydrogenase subunit 7 [Diplonema ambulator]